MMKRLNLFLSFTLIVFLQALAPFSLQAQCLFSDSFTAPETLLSNFWAFTNVNDSTAGTTQTVGGGALTIVADGNGIGAGGDSFRYIYQT
ncbi:MAG TPA: hypothetical protein VIJ93_06720, partial [bacterium]